jgi:hypothetical protein
MPACTFECDGAAGSTFAAGRVWPASFECDGAASALFLVQAVPPTPANSFGLVPWPSECGAGGTPRTPTGGAGAVIANYVF